MPNFFVQTVIFTQHPVAVLGGIISCRLKSAIPSVCLESCVRGRIACFPSSLRTRKSAFPLTHPWSLLFPFRSSTILDLQQTWTNTIWQPHQFLKTYRKCSNAVFINIIFFHKPSIWVPLMSPHLILSLVTQNTKILFSMTKCFLAEMLPLMKSYVGLKNSLKMLSPCKKTYTDQEWIA